VILLLKAVISYLLKSFFGDGIIPNVTCISKYSALGKKSSHKIFECSVKILALSNQQIQHSNKIPYLLSLVGSQKFCDSFADNQFDQIHIHVAI